MARALPTGVVTLVFTDIEGSSRLLEQAGPDYGGLLADHRRLLREAWHTHGGIEVDTQGDAFFVAFPTPQQGVRAASAAHAALAAHDWGGTRELRVRIGVHTGQPEVGQEGYWGADVHYGARLGAAAHGGQTLVSQATAALLGSAGTPELRSLGLHSFKDYLTPLEVLEVVDGQAPGRFPPPRSLPRQRVRLPVAPTPLVGRDSVLADLLHLVTTTPGPVSILGPGGSGKTRLALEAAHALQDRFDDVWFVALEGLREPDDVAAAVSRALGLPEVDDPQGQLTDYLALRSALLVLDNFEHLLDAARLVPALTGAGPDIRVLVTSQARLRIRGEEVLHLPPLALPMMDDDVEAAGVQLLLERARSAGASIELDPVTTRDVVRLVQMLEGMPLAIELAAARLDVMSPASLVRQLERGADVLGSGARDLPERQRGLRAVLDWTCGLLEPPHLELLAVLTSFVDGVDPEVVISAFPGAYDALAVLLDGGLVTRSEGRIALRPPVRRHAVTLIEPVRLSELRSDVVRALADLARPYEAHWLTDAGAGMSVLGPEQANLLASLDWAREHDRPGHADLVAASGWFLRTHTRIGNDHVRAALLWSEEAHAAPRLAARLLQAQSALSLEEADVAPSLAAAAAWEALGVPDRQALNLIYAANVLHHRGEDLEDAVLHGRRAVELLEDLPDLGVLRGYARCVLGGVLWSAGRRAEGESLVRAQQEHLVDGTPWHSFWAVTGLADIDLEAGRLREALIGYGQCVAWCLELDQSAGAVIQGATIVEALHGLGLQSEASSAWAVCRYAQDELGRPARSVVEGLLERSRILIGADLLPTATTEAAQVGVVGGLAWVGELARRIGEGS